MRWVYYFKAHTGANWLMVCIAVGTVLTLLLLGTLKGPDREPRAEDASMLFGVVMPLALGLLLAGLPAQERGAGMAEICLTYRQPAWLRLLDQTVCATLGWALLAVLAWAAVNFGYATFDTAAAARMVLPPALGLGGVALGAGALSKTAAGGTLAAAAWWSIDLLQPGLNRLNYLFSRFQPVDGLDPGTMQIHMLLTALCGLGLALLLAERRHRWVL